MTTDDIFDLQRKLIQLERDLAVALESRLKLIRHVFPYERDLAVALESCRELGERNAELRRRIDAMDETADSLELDPELPPELLAAFGFPVPEPKG